MAEALPLGGRRAFASGAAIADGAVFEAAMASAAAQLCVVPLGVHRLWASDDAAVSPFADMALPPFGDAVSRASDRANDWRQRFSNHVAYALLVYTALQVVATIAALKLGSGTSLLPFAALILLVVAILPACRHIESRWTILSETQAESAAKAGRYGRDVRALWVLAVTTPFAITLVFSQISALFG